MQHKRRWLVAAVAALALVTVGGVAFAAGTSHSAKRSGGRGAIVSAVASYLGLSTEQLRADLTSGETLAQIATAQRRSVSGLEQTIESAMKARLDQAVAAGKITSQREQLILSRLPARLDNLVNRAHPSALIRRGFLRRALIRVSAGYLSLTPQQLRSELRAGRTPAQVATAEGKTAAGLERAIETAVKARLDQAVAAGKITSQREQLVLARLSSRLDGLVNRTLALP